ncbi:MAG TPA: CDP-diacylglycerol--glycerol-3-phosphate 3-phosphatidyltransferase [Fastidiosipila sp.]|nr:CDP-diacylglycerol--glycerol-3-phosphate 3-phosphatidyltransferase [Fastidiosipila sp.]
MRVKVEWTIPNILTLLRLLAIPVLCFLIWQWPEHKVKAFVVFLAIWFTDLLDGYIARHYNMETEFGKLFDPLVDKIFQLATAITMFLINRIPVWVPLYLLVRELLMVFGSIFVLKNKDLVVHSSLIGKIATFLFVVAFAALFWVPSEPRYIRDLIFLPPVLVSFIATVFYASRNLFGNRHVHREENAKDA